MSARVLASSARACTRARTGTHSSNRTSPRSNKSLNSCRSIGEKHVALGVARGPLGELELAGQLFELRARSDDAALGGIRLDCEYWQNPQGGGEQNTFHKHCDHGYDDSELARGVNLRSLGIKLAGAASDTKIERAAKPNRKFMKLKNLVLLLTATFMTQLTPCPLGAADAKMTAEAREQFLQDFKRIGLNTTPGDAMTLRILVGVSGAKRGVEVGTATGYGALQMGVAFEHNGGHLDTIDIDRSGSRPPASHP